MPTTLRLLPIPRPADLPPEVPAVRIQPPQDDRTGEVGNGHRYRQLDDRFTFIEHEPDALAFLAALEADACPCVTAYRSLTARTPSPDAFGRLPEPLARYWLRLIGDTARAFLAGHGLQVESILARRTLAVSVTSGPVCDLWGRSQRRTLATFNTQHWVFLPGLETLTPSVLRRISSTPCRLCAPEPGERSHVRSPRHLEACLALFRTLPRIAYPRFTVLPAPGN